MPIFDIGHTDQFPVFLVTKYLEGGTLADWVQSTRPDFLTVAKLMADVADALHATHLKGIFHRDIKPANILVDAQGKPVLADFGLALKEGHGLDAGPEILGTPAYMSPEQAAGEGHRVDGQTDNFSLGVVLYELLAGVRPFRASEKLLPREQTLQLLEIRQNARSTTAATALGAGLPTPTQPISDRESLKIVPKGLRSFDAGDASFFSTCFPARATGMDCLRAFASGRRGSNRTIPKARLRPVCCTVPPAAASRAWSKRV